MKLFGRERPKDKGRFIGLFVSDTHAGHEGSLMNPEVKLFRKEAGEIRQYTPQLTDMQEDLWGYFTRDIDEAVRIADGCPILVTFNGDPTQGQGYASETVSYAMSNQMLIAFGNMRPLLEMAGVTHFRMASSTGSHVFHFASADTLLMTHLRHEFPEVDIRLVYHGLMTVNGASIDYAHKGAGPGIREWTKGNVARYYLEDIMFRDILHGEVPPSLVVRSHYHTYVEVFQNVAGRRSWLIITPAYQFPGDWTTHAIGSRDRVDFGMVAVEFIDGRIREIFPLKRTRDLRVRETINLE